jgi:predicted nuclease with TOPRIM domain
MYLSQGTTTKIDVDKQKQEVKLQEELEELKESLRSNKQNLAKVTCNHGTPIKKLVIETVSLEERISRLEKKKVDEVVQFPLEFGFRNLYCFHGL